MEYQHIVEFCYLPKTQQFVVRFLDGSSYALKTDDLPKKMQTKKPDWENSYLAPDKASIMFQAGKDVRQILPHIIHSKGRPV